MTQPRPSNKKPALPTTGDAFKVIPFDPVKRKVAKDICPKCGGELDTGWECNDCGYDAMGEAVPPKREG